MRGGEKKERMRERGKRAYHVHGFLKQVDGGLCDGGNQLGEAVVANSSLKPLPSDGAVLHHSCERSEHLTHQHTALLRLLQR